MKYIICADAKTLQPIDSVRATFGVKVQFDPTDPDLQGLNTPSDTYGLPHLCSLLHRIFSNSDGNFDILLGEDPEVLQIYQLGPYFVDSPLLNLKHEFCSDEQPFDWKVFLDSFFAVFAEARHLARGKNSDYLD